MVIEAGRGTDGIGAVRPEIADSCDTFVEAHGEPAYEGTHGDGGNAGGVDEQVGSADAEEHLQECSVNSYVHASDAAEQGLQDLRTA